MERALALVALLATGVAIVSLVALLLVRARGRPVPGWLVVAAAGAFGLGQGFFLVAFADRPLVYLLAQLVPAYLAFRFWREGRRVGLGAMLLGLGAMPLAWWGALIMIDLPDPAELYSPVVWLYWTPGLLLVVAGSLFIARGDTAPPAEQPAFPATQHGRDPMPLATQFRRALSLGGIPLPGIVSEGLAAVLVISAVLVAVRMGLSPVIAWVAGVAAFALLAVELWYLVMPRRLREAWEGFAVVGHVEMERWHAAEGGRRMPASLREVRTWLATSPERPEKRQVRAEYLGVLGEFDKARGLVDAMSDENDAARFEKLALYHYLDWMEGRDAPVAPLLDAAQQVGAARSAERLHARGLAAVAQAREAAATGEDWMSPLIWLRQEAGPASAARSFRRDTWGPRLRSATLQAAWFVGLLVFLDLWIRPILWR